MVRITAAFAFLVFVLAGHAAAQEPDLTGRWEAVSGHMRTFDGGTATIGESWTASVTITEQTGQTFTGTMRWENPQHIVQQHDGTRITRFGEETIIGVIDWDNTSFSIADTPDTGIMAGRLITDDMVQLTYVEAGERANVIRWILVRR